MGDPGPSKLILFIGSKRIIKGYPWSCFTALAFPEFERGFMLDGIASPFGFDLQLEIRIIVMRNYSL
ncbi:hypothetical protein [Candidatus Nitrosocosmicus sp. R]